jgi:mercuric ion transport protein
MLERILAATGAAAALAASTCCALPLGLSAAGVSGAWLSHLTALAPYQWEFRLLAILLLMAAFWMIYARRPLVAEGTACVAPPSQGFTKTALWFGALMMALVLTSGWWQQFLA